MAIFEQVGSNVAISNHESPSIARDGSANTRTEAEANRCAGYNDGSIKPLPTRPDIRGDNREGATSMWQRLFTAALIRFLRAISPRRGK
jgi:hypothetical protein